MLSDCSFFTHPSGCLRFIYETDANLGAAGAKAAIERSRARYGRRETDTDKRQVVYLSQNPRSKIYTVKNVLHKTDPVKKIYIEDSCIDKDPRLVLESLNDTHYIHREYQCQRRTSSIAGRV
jgi:hypothetical protein